MKSSYMIPAAIVFGGIIIAVAVYVSMPKKESLVANSIHPALMRPIAASDHIFGNPAARVVVIEYADFDCEPCSNFHDTMHQIIANEGASGEIAWVFRHFPLTEVHPNAFSLARAAECAASVAGATTAANNDAFWKFANTLYSKQPVAPSDLGTIAAMAGISDTAFATCYANASPTIDARITADRQNALDMGADGTPISIILTNGKNPVVMNGAYPYGAAQQLIDEALAR